MVKDGLIKRHERYDPKTGKQETNYYSFDGLIAAATPFAHEAIAAKEQRKAEAIVRRQRKRPKLFTVVGGSDADVD